MYTVIIWAAVALAAFVMFVNKKLNYFKEFNINHLPTTFGFGNMFKNFIRKEHFFDIVDNAYKAFPNDRFIGSYEFLSPTFIIRDVELIKAIGVKDFDYFSDHRPFTHEDETFFSKSLFALKGDKWRDMRSTLSPAFTASKLRNMVPFMQECSKNLSKHLIDDVNKNKDGKIVIDVRDALQRYATDVIATCAFGLKTNSIVERDNDFYRMGYNLTNSNFIQFIKFFFSISFPKLAKYMALEVFSPEATTFFTKVFLGTMKNREQNNIYRPDMLQLLMEAQKGTLKHEDVKEEKDAGFATVLESDVGKRIVKHEWDDQHIVAQAMLLFFAGFDTVSTAMTFLLHELSVHQDIQAKLFEEIEETLKKHDGKLDYDKINQMKYLDMCISETLRRWPPTGTTDRICLKNYQLGKPNENAETFVIPKDGLITIPVLSIHYDEKYYPNPMKFDPERFSDENKHNITPYIYLPFGIGPRNCVGSRFALAEIKTMAIDLLTYFKITPSASTEIPFKLDPSSLNTKIKGGHRLTFTLRSANN